MRSSLIDVNYDENKLLKNTLGVKPNRIVELIISLLADHMLLLGSDLLAIAQN